jgi:hypothetical protein
MDVAHPECREQCESVTCRLLSRTFEREIRGGSAETDPNEPRYKDDTDREYFEHRCDDLHAIPRFRTPGLKGRDEE